VRLALHALFWLSAAGVAATYVVYPAVLRLLVTLRGRPPATAGESPPPAVALVIVAHDEERSIEGRMRNLSELSYPPERLRILLISDGSTDATVRRAREAAPAHADIVEFAERQGKTPALLRALHHLEGDIVAFTDADSRFEPGALTALVAPFADPTVGCVVGCLSYVNTDQPRVGHGEGLYWRYENAIKEWESRLGSTIVANGSIYAVRRPLMRRITPEVDFDSMLPLLVIRDGSRVVFEPRARATEKAAESLAEEFARKSRIINQQIHGLLAVRGLIGWRTRWAAAAVFFHKLLRWAVPFLLVVNVAAALALGASPWARLAVGAHAIVALAAVAGWLLDRCGLPAGWLWVATYFWGVNLASFVAVISCLRGRRVLAWEKATSTR
jgi:cellulose synthase/poly-beta-1,6-N-acetylglucosamine synthase-like glycosyltransferase